MDQRQEAINDHIPAGAIRLQNIPQGNVTLGSPVFHSTIVLIRAASMNLVTR